MSLLTHPLLVRMAEQLANEASSVRWIDLYAAQFVANFIAQTNTELRSDQPLANAKPPSQFTDDLFNPVYEEEQPSLTESDVIVLAVMASFMASQGQTTVHLEQLPKEVLNLAKRCGYRPHLTPSHHTAIHVVEGDAETKTLLSENKPLVLSGKRLFLQKYWRLEQGFKSWLVSRQHYLKPLDQTLVDKLAPIVRQVFSSVNDEDALDWQMLAAAHTLVHPLSLISGGPGTGKTTTAASLLFLLMEKRKLERRLLKEKGVEDGLLPSARLSLRLLAPTGKAALRLADAIRQKLAELEDRCLAPSENGIADEIRMTACLPETGETVHRFLYDLGGLRDAHQRGKRVSSDALFLSRDNHEHTLGSQRKPLDIVILDEASMMDLALMVEFIRLIPATTQVILMGDHHQLPPVEPGQVFRECVERFQLTQHDVQSLKTIAGLTGYSQSRLESEFSATKPLDVTGFQALCELKKTYRFDGDLKIAAEFMKQGNHKDFRKQFWCASEHYRRSSHVTWYDLALSQRQDLEAIISAYRPYFELIKQPAGLMDLVTAFDRFQLLCSTLDGPLGVHNLNDLVERRLLGDSKNRKPGDLYHGKAILVTRNQPHLGIYNGDVGFVLFNAYEQHYQVHFPSAKQQAIVLPPGRIAAWQTAYAMTVHKSQGSEYQHVGLVLADYAKELLSRPLIYTGLTRAKESCEIWASQDALVSAFNDE